ncbi:MAG TPA: glycosyltransferase family 39 protein, partial [Phototrophicaceae bacterium]|nr:glycosyltransferase family 39 protein [Phototrophicaceae bacterium]
MLEQAVSEQQSKSRWMIEIVLVILLALVGAWLVVHQVIRPGYTDSFYHYNAAVRLASGQGLTDTYLWTYIGQPQPLPDQIPVQTVPSHLYWMPLTSLLAGGSMWLFKAPGNYAVAQFPLVLAFAGTILIGYRLGYRLGGTRRHAIVAAALTLFSGFFAKFWGETDTFAVYALVGSGCLLALSYGLEAQTRRLIWFLLAGVLAGLGHLTRADGLLLILTGFLAVIATVRDRENARRIPLQLFYLLIGYLIVMLPWFIRMIQVTGSPLPVGGLQGAWFTEYNDLFRFPPDANASEFFAGGIDLFLKTRWTAFIQNLQTLLFVEGYVVLMPLMLIGVWMAWRKQPRLMLPFLLFTAGIHVAMTLVFPFPGWRGGLLHGITALIPWWAALTGVGLDGVVDWIARRRRRWQPGTAKQFFSAAVIALAVLLSLSGLRGISQSTAMPGFYMALQRTLPPDARVLINDPAQLYYYIGLGGAVLPNESAEILPELARQYEINYVVLENVTEDGTGLL